MLGGTPWGRQYLGNADPKVTGRTVNSSGFAIKVHLTLLTLFSAVPWPF